MSVRTAEDLTDGKITPCVCRANRCSADKIHIAHALAVRTSNFISLGRCAALAAKTKQLIIAPLLDRPAQNSRLPGVRTPTKLKRLSFALCASLFTTLHTNVRL